MKKDMVDFDLNQFYHHIEMEINHLTQSRLFRHNEEMQKDAHEIVAFLKSDLNIWIEQLSEKAISIAELEKRVLDMKSKITIKHLATVEKEISQEEINMVVLGILHLIVNVIIEMVFDTYSAKKHSCIDLKGLNFG